MTQSPIEEIDALVIGAGITGLYQLYCLRQVGLDARIFEAGDGVGGTWYWNRYPGARLDSESWSYAYSFSRELLEEWDWSEEFVGQPELERYLNHVADKFALRPHIVLGARVRSLVFDDRANRWDVETEDGRRVRARFVVAATGLLSANHLPDIPGIESFGGLSFHTSRWPREKVDFAGKRVGIIGTGSTGVQLIPQLAKECTHLTVFQRTPNYCSPLRNAPIPAERMRAIKAGYDAIFETCRSNIGGFVHSPDPRGTFEVTDAERRSFYEAIWSQPGFVKWFGNFRDLMTDRDANEAYCEFVRSKIRERVKDPVVAELLCPKDHHFGAKRVPLETDYYEAYNRDNVLLVDVKADPIEAIVPTGVRTKRASYDLDVLIHATGFDAATGEVLRMDVRGVGGESLRSHWDAEPTAYMGLSTAGFPNLFFENGTLFCNFTRCAEATAEFVARCLGHLRDQGYRRIEADPKAEARWVERVRASASATLVSDVSNWMNGSNIPGKPKAQLIFAEGFAAYLELCREVEERGYAGFNLE
ncbi:MAG: NAD(P)/FAD-dependent oxidoreductase [Myxococcota bacterium]